MVAHLLQQRQSKHLTLDLLHAMEALLRAVGPSEGLHTAVLQRLLLNLRLWAAAPLPIQRSFQALLLKLAKVWQDHSTARNLSLCDCCPVQRRMLSLALADGDEPCCFYDASHPIYFEHCVLED